MVLQMAARKLERDVRSRGSLLLLAALLLLPLPASAEVTPVFMAQSVSARPDGATDALLGQDSKGPYMLSRQMILPGSETVTVDGRRVLPPAYQVDYNAGTLLFDAPLSKGQVARVDYTFDAKTSKANFRPPSAPLSLDVAHLELGPLGQSTVQFSGAYKVDQNAPTVTALGMGLNTQIGGATQVGALFALSPRTTGTDRAGSDLDASGMQVTAATTLGAMQAKMKYVRTGSAFAAAQQYQWQQGLQLFDVSTSYSVGKWLVARSSLQRSETLGLNGASGPATTTTQHEVVASLTPTSKLTLGHSEQDVAAPDAAGKTSTTDRVQLDQQLGGIATAQLRHEIAVADDGKDAKTTETTGVKIDAKVPGATHITAERVEAKAEDKTPAINTQVGLSTGVGSALQLEGKYAQQLAPGQDPQETKSARLVAAPVNGLKIGGGVTQTLAGTQEQVGKDASVELKSYAGLQLTGRFASLEDSEGHPLSITRSLDARLKPFQALEVSGTYKERERDSQSGPLTRGLKVSLAPVQFLQLTGSVVRNPEENSQVLEEERRAVGLRSNLGPLTLAGDYSQRLALDSTPIAREMEFSLGIQLTRYDRFFSAYRLGEQMSGDPLQTARYRVGYTRSLGSTFGLSIEGEYLQYQQGDRILWDQNEARAKAGLEARF